MKCLNIITLFFITIIYNGHAQTLNIKKIFSKAEQQTAFMMQSIKAAQLNNPDLVSPRSLQDTLLKLVPSRDWTSGFFPGELWFLYEYTQKEKWKRLAEQCTLPLEKEKLNGTSHDVGFKIYCSFGNGYRLSQQPHYKDVILQGAKTLRARFNSVAGVIRSWDQNKDKWDYPVIIDNMMNLELLFAATQLSGDSSFYRIAVSHANNTMKNHFRSDNSSFHVVDYDSTTGKVIKRTTHQGYADSSAWSRGQAWGVYGYTMCYRFTKDPRYLAQAEKIAAYMLYHPNMPKDLVPYWDYNAPNIPNEERDVSAAAVLASALFELSTYSTHTKEYKKKARKILSSLTNHYRSPIGENKGFILLHSTGSKPAKSEVNVPLIYADYYYIEALLRSRSK